jgi:hypothetical protein
MSEDVLQLPFTPEYDYDGLKKFSSATGRPFTTLIALAPPNDPFAAGMPSRLERAKWAERLWKTRKIVEGDHLRRVHYRLVSQKRPITKPDRTPYENTEDDWKFLVAAVSDARHLDLINAGALVDRRNDEPVINLDPDEEDCDADIVTDNTEFNYGAEIELPPLPALPRLRLDHPHIPQPYHVEIWCEKSTINDILFPLGEQYGANIVTGVGEMSITRCVALVERALESGRPVRILYVSDFDPAGLSMPVAVARKIEHRLYLQAIDDLDIQVIPIVLTHEQCRHYGLPRTPLKETERRADRFERRFGEGATELDALEALHPGELKRIITREIERYFDVGLDDQIAEAARPIENEIMATNAAVRKEHAEDIKRLEREYREITKDFRKRLAEYAKRAKPVWRAIANSLADRELDIDAVDWPEPRPAREHFARLYDSTRDYVEQMDTYKRFQGKPIKRKQRGGRR